MKKIFYKYLIVLFAIFQLFLCSNTYPQYISIRENTFYYPRTLKLNELNHTIGLSTAKLPEDVVESDDAFRAPLFAYRIKYGLPLNITAEGSFETNIITYHFSLGGKWNYEFGKLSMSAGADAAFWFGSLDQYGFDTKIDGWHIYPNISLGYKFLNFNVSVKSELILILAQSTRSGDIKTENTYDNFSGYSIGVYIEQPLWKENYIVMGFKSNFTKFYYPLWAGFSTFDRYFFIPEFVFSFNL